MKELLNLITETLENKKANGNQRFVFAFLN